MPALLPPNPVRGDLTQYDGISWRALGGAAAGYTLVYNAATKLWEAQPPSGGGVSYGPVTPEPVFGSASANGAASTVSHSDHAHGNPVLDASVFAGWKFIPIPGGTYNILASDWLTYNQMLTVNGTATINLPAAAQPRMEIIIVVSQNNVTCTVQAAGPPYMLMPDGFITNTVTLTTPVTGGGFTRIHLICDGANWFVHNEAGSVLRTDGDLLYRTNGHVARLGVGSAKQVLQVTSGLPAWAALDQSYLASGSYGAVTAEPTPGSASANGVATTLSRSDHAHGNPTAAAVGAALTYGAVTAEPNLGSASANGTATTPSRSDHAHGNPASAAVTAEPTVGSAAANGAATTVARSDHAHGNPTAASIIAALFPAWTAYTPTIAAGAGTFTTVSGAGSHYLLLGKTLFLTINVNITTNGSAAGFITFTMPAGASVNGNQTFTGRNFNTGLQLQGYANGGTGVILNQDNTYPGATGYTLTMQAVFEVA